MGWLSGWTYRKSHVINPASGAGTLYQKRVKVHYGAGVDSGEDVYLNGKCRTDFGDVRFTGADGATLLDYWIEEKVDSDHATIWVEVADDLSTTPVTIYIYYGKSDATTTSNGPATFQSFRNLVADEYASWGAVPLTTYANGTDPGDRFLPSTLVDAVYVSPCIYFRYYGGKKWSLDSSKIHFEAYSDYGNGGECGQDIRMRTSAAPTGWRTSNAYTADATLNRKHILVVDYQMLAGSGSLSYFSTWSVGDDIPSGTVAKSTTLSSTARVQIEDVYMGSVSHIKIAVGAGASIDLYAVYHCVAKYVDPEPAHGSWGSEEGTPAVVTDSASGVTDTEATLNGEITDTGGATVDERGFDWGTESGVYPYSWTEKGAFGVGAFSHALTGLVTGTKYYFRAKAHNAFGWGYGSEKSFCAYTTKVDMRLSNVDPPAPEPKRTIYRDIVNLPDPVKLGLTIRYFNHDDVDLYFQITGSGTGYTFGTVNLGLLASGADAYKNLDEFASRAKPSASDLPNGEKEENITLILKAYTDSGYTNLKWTFERVVTVHWINSADPAFTVDVLNNFDDGTVQGWAARSAAGALGLGVVTDYVLSPPYSVRLSCFDGYLGSRWFEVYKSFTTPDKPKVYAIIDCRVWGQTISGAHSNPEYLTVYQGSNPFIYCGPDFPESKWVRFVVPLVKNTTAEIIIHLLATITQTPSGEGVPVYLWLDDFRIISKY